MHLSPENMSIVYLRSVGLCRVQNQQRALLVGTIDGIFLTLSKTSWKYEYFCTVAYVPYYAFVVSNYLNKTGTSFSFL